MTIEKGSPRKRGAFLISNLNPTELGQRIYAKAGLAVKDLRLRRIAPPTRPKPNIIIAQVAGSGTGAPISSTTLSTMGPTLSALSEPKLKVSDPAWPAVKKSDRVENGSLPAISEKENRKPSSDSVGATMTSPPPLLKPILKISVVTPPKEYPAKKLSDCPAFR